MSSECLECGKPIQSSSDITYYDPCLCLTMAMREFEDKMASFEQDRIERMIFGNDEVTLPRPGPSITESMQTLYEREEVD